MRSTLSKPWLSLITLLLLGSGLGWYLATKDGDQSWLVFVAAWAGASVGILAMPFFELLAKPLANLISRRIVAVAVAIGISIALALVAHSILITELGVGEVIVNGFFTGFLPPTVSGVTCGAGHLIMKGDDNWLWEKYIVTPIFSITILCMVIALNVFELTSGIARFAFVFASYSALTYATARVAAWTIARVRPTTNYFVFQSLQILALIFGTGLDLGWVTTSLLI